MPAMHPLPHHLPQVVSWDSSYVLGISGNHTGFGIRLPAFSLSSAAKSLQSCLTLCDPLDGSPPGSAVPGILQARILEWAAISFSNAWKCKVKVKLFSHVRLFVTPWTAAHQAPLPMGFSRQEYWSGLPLPSPGLPLPSPFGSHGQPISPVLDLSFLNLNN